MPFRTGDRATFYTTEQIGPSRTRTPEGYLILHDVPIARTGEMIYGPGETPVAVGPDGMVVITRSDEEVFNPTTVTSLNGKPLTDDHPDQNVGPDNWQGLAKGTVFDPRRGEGEHQDMLVADIMVTRRDAINAIDAGKVEVSAGYDANYFQLQPGRGEQRDIIFNHVALVDRGRCGPRCAIGDRDRLTDETEDLMGSTTKTVMQRLREQLGIDTTKFDEACAKVGLSSTTRDEEGGGSTGSHHFEIHNHIPGGEEKKTDDDDPTEKRFRKIEDAVGGMSKDLKRVADAVAKIGDKKGRDEDEDETEEEKKKRLAREKGEDRGKGKDDLEDLPNDVNAANKKILGQLELEVPPGVKVTDAAIKDSAILQHSFQETVALAEILVPGIRVPTFDSAAQPAKTFDGICGLRRDALQLAFNGNPAMRGMIGDAFGIGTAPLDTRDKRWTCDTIRTVFRTAAAVASRANNAAPFQGGGYRPASTADAKVPRTPADLNKLHSEHWKTH